MARPAIDVPRDVLALDITEDDMRMTPKPVIVNCVATYNFTNRQIATELVTLRLPGMEYNPRRFVPGQLRMPRSMTLVFSGGGAVCPGSRSVADARLAILNFIEMHLRCGEYVQMSNFGIENIVMSVCLPFEVQLTTMVEEWSAYADYDSAKFPGASFRFGCGKNGTIVFNVYVGGKVVITRSRNVEHSYKAWYWFYTHVLLHHQLGTAAGTTSSSAYRMEAHRRRDTFADDCSRLASRHIRRPSGAMATTPAYSEHVTATPRSSRHSTPSLASTPLRSSSTTVSFERPVSLLTHSYTCPYVKLAREGDDAVYAAYCEVRDGTGDLDTHGDASCVRVSRDDLAAQLLAILGKERVHRVEVLLAGHTLACPLVMVASGAERRVWLAHCERLEGVLAGAEPAHDVLRPCRRAGCFAADHVDFTSAEHVDTLVRTFSSQLLAALKVLDETSPDPHAIDVEAVVDYEARFSLDALRGALDASDMAVLPFDLDDL